MSLKIEFLGRGMVPEKKKQNVFWKAELISDMTDKVVFRKSMFKTT